MRNSPVGMGTQDSVNEAKKTWDEYEILVMSKNTTTNLAKIEICLL